jgi:hypothetical protein
MNPTSKQIAPRIYADEKGSEKEIIINLAGTACSD